MANWKIDPTDLSILIKRNWNAIPHWDTEKYNLWSPQ